MNGLGAWTRGARLRLAVLPNLRHSLGMARVPEAPVLPVRDPWPGDPSRGARLLKGELEYAGAVRRLRAGEWLPESGRGDDAAERRLRAHAHGFTWLRDLRALGTEGARLRARALVADWLGPGARAAAGGRAERGASRIGRRPDVAGARIAAWLGHYDFFAASADDAFRHRLMGRLVADARTLAAMLPAEELDARALVALKGLVAASVALPEHAGSLTRALRFLPQEIGRQVLPDGCHAERSPAAQLAALQELVEIRALLQGAQVTPPPALAVAIERMAAALRAMRHGDGALALFNGSREETASLVELTLAQAGRTHRPVGSLVEGGFHRLQAGRTLVLVDAGAPPPPGIDRFSHAGTLAMEVSIGRDRLIVNCGASPAGPAAWRDAMRATAAHSTLTIADTSSAELTDTGLARRPLRVEAQRQESGGAVWLEASHDGYERPFGATHRRRLYLAGSGEDLRGEDVIEAAAPLPYTLRFHLHPNVRASMQQDGGGVLLRLPTGGWRLRADGARIALEESVYLGGAEPRRSEQVVLTGGADGPQHVKWAITKV